MIVYNVDVRGTTPLPPLAGLEVAGPEDAPTPALRLGLVIGLGE